MNSKPLYKEGFQLLGWMKILSNSRMLLSKYSVFRAFSVRVSKAGHVAHIAIRSSFLPLLKLSCKTLQKASQIEIITPALSLDGPACPNGLYH